MEDLRFTEHEEELPSLSGVTCQTVKKEERKLGFVIAEATSISFHKYDMDKVPSAIFTVNFRGVFYADRETVSKIHENGLGIPKEIILDSIVDKNIIAETKQLLQDIIKWEESNFINDELLERIKCLEDRMKL